MLNLELVKKIENFVYDKPRTIQEIALMTKKNWRTADRYVETIKKDFGTLSIRTFREGTRGALKIVYFSNLEKAKSNVFQEQLEKQVILARKKEDFSAFDIFQHVSDKNKKVSMIIGDGEKKSINELVEFLKKAKKQILMFSGNLSFINLKEGNNTLFNIIEELIKKGVSIKVISRVDIVGKKNIEKMLSLNFKYGKELIEIRHSEQPLRGVIIDNNLFRIKEIKEPTGKLDELNKKLYLFYTIKDKEWVEWISRIFWKIFSSSIDSKKRIQEMGSFS